MTVQQRYETTRKTLDEVCKQAGRAGDDVRLIAVSKTVGLDEVAEAIAAGASDFGENRPDQLMEKADAFPQVRWHFIGNIQSRRIRDIVGRACLIHSLTELSHARKIDVCAAALGITQDVLLEVNVSGEQSKSGLSPEEVKGLLDEVAGMAHVRVCGLMTMAPQGDMDEARKTFRGLAALARELRSQMDPSAAAAFCELSMGMSEDWHVAVEEGATMVRIGRAIFSESF